MTDTSYAPDAPAPEVTKKTVSKRDVTAAIAALAPEKPAEISAGDKERAKKKALVEERVRSLAASLENIGVGDGNPSDAVAVFKALAVVIKKSQAAIDSLSDAKLGLVEKAPAKPRAARVQDVSEHVEAGQVGGVSIAGQDVEPEGAEAPGNQGVQPQQDDDAAREQRQAERLDAAKHSGPTFPPRGDTDPNANDGF